MPPISYQNNNEVGIFQKQVIIITQVPEIVIFLILRQILIANTANI